MLINRFGINKREWVLGRGVELCKFKVRIGNRFKVLSVSLDFPRKNGHLRSRIDTSLGSKQSGNRIHFFEKGRSL